MTIQRILSNLSDRMSTTSRVADREVKLSGFLKNNVGIDIPARNLHIRGDAGARQRAIADLILQQLRKKGISASEAENWQLFGQDYRLSMYSAPEQAALAPGGVTIFTESTGNIKIYLNPYIDVFNQDYRLLTVVEEGMHAQLLGKEKKARPIWNDEVTIKEQLLEAADLFEFSEERKNFIIEERDKALAKLEIDDPGRRL